MVNFEVKSFLCFTFFYVQVNASRTSEHSSIIKMRTETNRRRSTRNVKLIIQMYVIASSIQKIMTTIRLLVFLKKAKKCDSVVQLETKVYVLLYEKRS